LLHTLKKKHPFNVVTRRGPLCEPSREEKIFF
jgi:hypothetical protein